MEQDEQLHCPLCNRSLNRQSDGYWCGHEGRYFDLSQINNAREWRQLGYQQKIERFKALGRDSTLEKYLLHNAQVAELERLISESRDVTRTIPTSVVPSKNSLLGLARGISDATALCELIDNAIDAGRLRRAGRAIRVEIELNDELGKLIVRDNAGGMSVEDMRRCFTLGSHRPDDDALANAIGRYGIGAKEAFYHFGREIIVRSMTEDAPTGIRTVVGHDWLNNKEWQIGIDEGLHDIERGTTLIEVGRLEKQELDRDIPTYLYHTYERLIQGGSLKIVFQGNELEAVDEPTKLYPRGLEPRTYSLKSGNVDVIIDVALIARPPAASGIFLYAQGRRFAHYPWGDLTVKMLMDGVQKHQLREKIRVQVSFDGPIDEIPINSNKSSLRSNGLLEIISRLLSKIVAPYFKAIPPLSQDRSMSLVNGLIQPESEDRSGIEYTLGRVSITSPISNAILGDINAFKKFLESHNTSATVSRSHVSSRSSEALESDNSGVATTIFDGHNDLLPSNCPADLMKTDMKCPSDGTVARTAGPLGRGQLTVRVDGDPSTLTSTAVLEWIQEGERRGIVIVRNANSVAL